MGKRTATTVLRARLVGTRCWEYHLEQALRQLREGGRGAVVGTYVSRSAMIPNMMGSWD